MRVRSEEKKKRASDEVKFKEEASKAQAEAEEVSKSVEEDKKIGA